ncbi:MAG: hypothetical protein NWQ23_12000 [Yoonia sp.]|uniref:hypothetical protein n=1 Tax=Yoonia sp. TaxID=2212373 RepID=UPI00273E2AF8|nr:hypothetical protein [Yoonia sp.]MDP5086136.1 hypothetical protein [Yoonia sp.]
MSRKPKPTVFLQRASYRQRRLRDASKLLPFVGIVLFAIPLAWTTQGPDQKVGSLGLIYVFGAWFALIAVSGVLTSLIRPDRTEDDNGPPEP